MLRNYLKIAVRNIVRHKTYAFINIAGLAIGMAVCLMIMMWVQNELSFDQFHTNSHRIYRLCTHLTVSGTDRRAPMTGPPMAPAMMNDFPEIVNGVRLTPLRRMAVKYEDKIFYEGAIHYADSSLFDVFTFPLIKGDPHTALAQPYSVVITEAMAQKYFGDEDPLGKALTIDYQREYTVTGVAENTPNNSHLDFDLVCSFQTLYVEQRQGLDVWGWLGYYTYLLLDEGADYQALEAKFPALVEEHSGERLRAVGGSLVLFLQPMPSIHLHSDLLSDFGGDGNITSVYFFSGIAVFILLMACINFINLSTARSVTRAREVGMRKVLGANRGGLIRQFLFESILYSLVAMVLARALVEICLPILNSITGQALVSDVLQRPLAIGGTLGLVLLIGLMAGSYPALFLSAFRPVRVLKGDTHSSGGGFRLRRSLAVVQFALSISLIIGTLVTHSQLSFWKTQDLGFDQDQVVVLSDLNNLDNIPLSTLKQELAALPEVIEVSASNAAPGLGGMMSTFLGEGFAEDEAQFMRLLDVDENFVPTLGLEIVAGRNFSSEFATDSADAAIINETAAALLGWDDPVGKIIKRRLPSPGGPPQWEEKTVVGVVKDFNLNPLQGGIEPMFMGNYYGGANMLSLRISEGNMEEGIEALGNEWERLLPNRPLDYEVLRDVFDSFYWSEERLGDIALSFTVLAVFIGCLGLFGMASYTAERRTREIGVRKVLGASVATIVQLLSGEVIIVLVVSNVLAWPIAYYFTSRWLEDFAYRTEIGWVTFALAGGLALVIALATVCFQAIKAALANPIDAIRYE